MMTSAFRALERRQLDLQLGPDARLRATTPPERGWIASIRNAIGMNLRQLAARVGVSAQAISELEKGERTGTISINSLRRVADALDCDVVVAIVPRVSLSAMVEERANGMEHERQARVAHTMSLEAQSIDVNATMHSSDPTSESERVDVLLKRLWD